MDADELKLLTELRRTHLKRLRVLELQTAKQAQETPASTQYKELCDTIADIDQKLATAQQQTSVQEYPLPTATFSQMQRVEIVVRGNVDRLTPQLRDATVRAIAAVVDIPPEQITVLRVVPGSGVYQLTMPR